MSNDDVTPVAARIDPAEITTDANLHVQVTGATRKFHLWQQGPAWLLGFAAVGLGFLMVLRGYDSPSGWFAVSTAIVLAVIASFRSPFSIGETALSTAPGHRPRKPARAPPPPTTNGPTG
ncbi:MAG: hypothetical protein JWM06_890 [Actinomycetia bacterium]|nr:hypothetical protein [Actinomycetes bacterium]